MCHHVQIACLCCEKLQLAENWSLRRQLTPVESTIYSVTSQWHVNLFPTFSSHHSLPSSLKPPQPISRPMSPSRSFSASLSSHFAAAFESSSRGEWIERARRVNTRITRRYDIRCSCKARRDYALKGLRPLREHSQTLCWSWTRQ